MSCVIRVCGVVIVFVLSIYAETIEIAFKSGAVRSVELIDTVGTLYRVSTGSVPFEIAKKTIAVVRFPTGTSVSYENYGEKDVLTLSDISSSTLATSEERTAPSGGSYTQNEAEQNALRYGKMKKKGLGMLIGGGAATLFGILMVTSADWETSTTATSVNKSTQDPQGGLGILLLVPGIPLTISGLVVNSISPKTNW